MNLTDMFGLDGRIALVTGGSRGIGKMIVEGYLAAGAARRRHAFQVVHRVGRGQAGQLVGPNHATRRKLRGVEAHDAAAHAAHHVEGAFDDHEPAVGQRRDRGRSHTSIYRLGTGPSGAHGQRG